MKSNVEKLSSLQRKLTIEVPLTTVQTSFDRIFNDIQKEVTLKGFRKGKAPLSSIKSMYNSKVKQDVMQDLIQKHYSKALIEHKLEPISYPEFEFDDLHEEKEFNFSAIFDIRPEVNLKKYENLEVEKEVYAFDENQIDKTLEKMRTAKASLQDITESRPAQLGDTAVINYNGFVDDQPLEGGAGEGHLLELGSHQFIEGFEEGIVGMNIQDEKSLTLRFPTPYHSKELEGKEVIFKVKLLGLKTKVLPEMNDEFIKASGTGVSSVEEFRKVVRADLEASEKKQVEDAFKNRLLKTLVKENPVEVPSSLLKEQKNSLIEDFKKRMEQQGMAPDSMSEYIQKWDKDFEKTASEMIQSSFLVDALGRKYELLCTQEDINKKFAEYAAQTGIDESRIREFYSKEETMSRLTYQITEEKVLGKLMETVKIKEMTKEQLKEEEN